MADTLATFADGYYWVVSADETANCLDARGGLDQSGLDVWYWARNRSDAQLVSLRNVTQGGVTGFTLRFPLCGRFLDVEEGTAKPVSNGRRVQTWDASGARNQVFQAVDQGTTRSIDGAARRVVKLRSCATRASGDTKSYCLDGSGASASAGTVVWLWEEYAGGRQNWCLVPVAQPPSGTYTIRPATAPTLCVDVAYGSVQAGANAQLYACGDQNNQKFVVSDGKPGDDLLAVCGVASGLYLDVDGGAAQIRDGRNVQMWTGNGADSQQWAFVASGTVKVDGATYDAFEVAPQAGTNFRMDAAGGGTHAQDNVQVYTRNGSDFQRWALVPDEATATDVAAPTGVGLVAGGKRLGKSAGVRGALSAYPRWDCQGTMWKLRYRTKTRKPGGAWGSWSAWRSVALGDAGNSGWGDVWSPQEVTKAGGSVTSAHAIALAVDNSACDGVMVEVEVRRFLDSWGKAGACAHTASGSGACTFAWLPKVTLGPCGFGPAGLTLAYSTDSRRDGHSLRVSSDLFGEVTLDKAARSGSVTVPLSRMTAVPADGQKAAVSYRLTTCDGQVVTGSQDVTVAYDAGSGMDLSPTAERDSARRAWLVTCSQASSCWTLAPGVLGGARFMACERLADGRFLALPPLGSEGRLFLFGSSADGSRWAVRSMTLAALPAREHVWNFASGACVALRAGEGDPPKVSHSLSPDSEGVTTEGRDLPVVAFGRTVSASCGVTAAVIEEPDAAASALRSLAASGRDGLPVTYRDPFGFAAEVAVTGVGMPRSLRGHYEVDVEQEAVG